MNTKSAYILGLHSTEVLSQPGLTHLLGSTELPELWLWPHRMVGGTILGGQVRLRLMATSRICWAWLSISFRSRHIESSRIKGKGSRLKHGQGNQCRTLWVKFESPVVQFSNCMTNLDILRTNFQSFPAIKMSHKNLSSKCPIKMSRQNASSKCLIKMSHQNVASKCFIKMSHQNVFKMSPQMSHQNVSSKFLIKMSHKYVSSKGFRKMPHQNVSLKCLINMSHQKFSSKCLIKICHKMSH